MRHITRILSVVKESFYGPERYARVAESSAFSGIKYAFFAALIGTLSFVSMFWLGMSLFSGVELNREAVNRIYPEGLVITIKDGVASTNMDEPIAIRTEDFVKAFNFPEKLITVDGFERYENVVVINTKTSPTIEEVEQYNAWAVVGSKSIFMHDQDGTIKVSTISPELQNETFGEEDIATGVEAISSLVAWGIPVIIATIALFFVVFFAIFLLALAAPAALVVKLISLIRGFQISYNGAYAVSLLAMVAVSLVGSILGFLLINLPFIVDLILFCVLIVINMRPHVSTPTPASVPTA